MKILPRTVPAGEPPAKEIDPPRTVQRSIEITIEREFLAVVNQPGSSFTALCSRCRMDVLMLTAEAAALATGSSPREVYRWLESGQLHFQELPTGKIYICSLSLKPFHRDSAQPPDQISSGEPL